MHLKFHEFMHCPCLILSHNYISLSTGDFILHFLKKIENKGEIKYIGTCNELNAAYAADGYARVKGIGCFVATYAVGELSGINAIAGAYAERVPGNSA